MTNADKIRKATDEKLAVVFQKGCCRPDLWDCPQDDCVDCWLDWLKEEVPDETD